MSERFRRVEEEGVGCARDERTRKRAADERTIYRYT